MLIVAEMGKLRQLATFCSVCSVLLGFVAVSGCESEQQKRLRELNITEDQAKKILADISAKRAHPPAPKSAESSGTKAPTAAASAAATADGNAQSGNEPTDKTTDKLEQALDPTLIGEHWIVDGLVDVAPAARSAATGRGVVLVTEKDELQLARLGRPSTKAEPAESPVTALPDDAGPFKVARGPVATEEHAYWISSHKLLRRPLTPPFEPLEVLTEDARVGTRPAALELTEKGKAWVSYVALPAEKDGPLRAKLWYGESNTLVLSPEGSSALSVGVVHSGDKRFAISMEARTGVTSLHARELVGDPPKALEDQVVWVGGAAHPMTELHIVRPQDPHSPELLSLIPLQQDVTHFGMALLQFGNFSQRTEPDVNWTLYKNGIDPAPITSSVLCGQTAALFARPTSAEPRSPQELVLATLIDGKPKDEIVLARSKAFFDISLASLATSDSGSSTVSKKNEAGKKTPKASSSAGALLSYVADYRTWARTIRCVR